MFEKNIKNWDIKWTQIDVVIACVMTVILSVFLVVIFASVISFIFAEIKDNHDGADESMNALWVSIIVLYFVFSLVFWKIKIWNSIEEDAGREFWSALPQNEFWYYGWTLISFITLTIVISFASDFVFMYETSYYLGFLLLFLSIKKRPLLLAILERLSK